MRRRPRAPLSVRPARGRRVYLARPGGRRDEEDDGLDVLLALDGGPAANASELAGYVPPHSCR